jgi:uncharacterized protein
VSGRVEGRVPEPELDAGEREALRRGVAQFNDRLFFECHDTLEELWSGVRGPSRDFFQGLVQVAVGFYHLGNRNRVGAARVLRRGRARLEGYPPRYAGVELTPLLAAVDAWLAALEAGAEPPPGPPHIAAAGSGVA